MKINPNIVNRALKKAGQEELTEDDILNNSNDAVLAQANSTSERVAELLN